MNKIENKAGVYRITNTENGKIYYGSSKELRDRWTHHKSAMRMGTHNNPGIREDVANCGVEAFEFTVMFYCKPEERKGFEGVLIDQNLGEGCYNRMDGNGSYDHTEESKALMSAAHFGKTFSEEHKANLSAAKKGKTLSDETKARMSAARKGRTLAKTTCPHCGEVGGGGAMKRWHFDNCKHRQE